MLFFIPAARTQDGKDMYKEAKLAIEDQKYSQALKVYQDAIPLLLAENHMDMYLEACIEISVLFYWSGELNLAITYADFARTTLLKKSVRDPILYSACLSNLASYHYAKRDISLALKYEEESLIHTQFANVTPAKIAARLNNNALTLDIVGDFDKAIVNAEKGLSLRKEFFGKIDINVANSLFTLGIINKSKGDYETARNRLIEAKEILTSLKETGVTVPDKEFIKVFQNLAECFLNMDQLDSSRYYLLQTTKFQEDEYTFRKYLSSELYARLYEKERKYELAKKANQLARKSAIEEFKNFQKHPVIARQFTHTGEIFLSQHYIDSAVQYFHHGVMYLANGFYDWDLYANPSVKQFFLEYDAIRSLRGKAKALYIRYLESKDIKDLQASLDTYQLTHDFIKKLKEDITTMGSKQRLAGDVLEIYEEAIETALALHAATADEQYLEKALFFAESNKAILLLESMNERMAQSVSGIPDTLLEKERQYRVDISYYEREINEENNKKAGEPNGDKIKEWDDKLYSLRREYQQLIDRFEAEYPKYHRLKYDTRLATIQDIRRDMLDSKTAFLEYFVGQKNIYLFEITKADFKVHQLEKLEDFEEDIREIQRMAKKPQLNTEEVPDFQEKIYSIYQHYLARALEYLPSGINRLLIIPDDVLNLIPFELLSRSAERSDFLIQDYTIGYTYSASLFKAGQKPGESVADHLFLGYAPAFAAAIAQNRSCSGDQLADLENSDREVLGIQALLGGNVMLGTEANRDSFLAQAGHYRIIHLATHACMDEENPMQSKVFFADDPIVNQDLFNLNLSADLAVLSACNTGSGQLVKGDGVLSLSKGFVHAGCPSAVMSLWSVDDFSTSEIMIDFYDYLKKGYTKDKALRKAKLDFIASADKVKKHPFFWAAFVQMGDPVALDLGQVRMPWKMILVASALALIGGYFIRRRSLAV